MRSQWTLECENIPRLTFGAGGGEYQSAAAVEGMAVDQPEARPELLRWRIRRRGYRLASRLLGRNGDASTDCRHSLLSSAEQPDEKTLPEELPEAPPSPPDERFAARSKQSDQSEDTASPARKKDLPRKKLDLPDLVLD